MMGLEPTTFCMARSRRCKEGGKIELRRVHVYQVRFTTVVNGRCIEEVLAEVPQR